MTELSPLIPLAICREEEQKRREIAYHKHCRRWASTIARVTQLEIAIDLPTTIRYCRPHSSGCSRATCDIRMSPWTQILMTVDARYTIVISHRLGMPFAELWSDNQVIMRTLLRYPQRLLRELAKLEVECMARHRMA